MSRFLKAELATVFRKPKLYVLLIVMLVGFTLGALIDIFMIKSGSMVGEVFIFVFYAICAIILVADISHKEYKFGTMKNLIGCGFTRANIYVGKYITTMIVTLIFILFEKVVKWIYCLCRGTFDSSVFISSDIMDILRQFFMFSLIFVICMLIVSDSVSLVVSMLYGLILPLVMTIAGGLIFGTESNVVPKVSAILMLSGSIYTDSRTNVEGVVVRESIKTSGLVWFFIGIVFVVALLIGGFQMFKRKEIK